MRLRMAQVDVTGHAQQLAHGGAEVHARESCKRGASPWVLVCDTPRRQAREFRDAPPAWSDTRCKKCASTVRMSGITMASPTPPCRGVAAVSGRWSAEGGAPGRTSPLRE